MNPAQTIASDCAAKAPPPRPSSGSAPTPTLRIIAPAHGERRDEEERIQRADTFGALGVAIAHEVNQPLAAITLHAAAAGKWLRKSPPDIERALASLALIEAAGRQAADVVRSVHRMASRQELEFGEIAVDDAVSQTLDLVRHLLRRHGIELELALGLAGCTIQANRVQLQQVITNLLVNAVEALAGTPCGAGTRRIRVASRRYNGDQVEIAVSDNGPGIAPAERERVFGRLYTTKPDSTGMGLAISLAIARAHGGEVKLEACEPHGACLRVRLPVRGATPCMDPQE